MTAKYPTFTGAVVALDKDGNHGAACHGIQEFPYSVASVAGPEVQVFRVPCVESELKRREKRKRN